MKDILGFISRTGNHLASLDPEYAKEQQQKAALKKVGDILGGQGMTGKGMNPNQVAQSQLAQIYGLGSPEAVNFALPYMQQQNESRGMDITQQNNLANQELTAEQIMAQRAVAESKAARLAQAKPSSPEAKLAADYKAGLIDKGTYDKAITKELTPKGASFKQYQLQAAGFADRMAKAHELSSALESEPGADVVNNFASAVGKLPLIGDFLENENLSPQQQQYQNAADEWIRAKLRKESGAVINNNEWKKEFRTYFPVPGDDKEVIKQKAIMRLNNTNNMIKQSGGAYEDQYDGSLLGAPVNKVIQYDAKGNIVQ